MIYEKMCYTVRHNGNVSDVFHSEIGILIGDTASPILWILYLMDFFIPETTDDVELFTTFISHLEQADDLLLLAATPEGLQRKLDIFYRWCQDNFMVVNAIISVVCIHGHQPRVLPSFP